MNRAFKILIKSLLIIGFIVAVHNSMTWKDSIKNPDNSAYVVEVAFNLDIEPYQVTQAQFNRRYK